MKHHYLKLGLLALATGLPALSASAQEGQPDACAGEESFLCGPINAEDILELNEDWVLTSRIGGPGDTEGMFYLIETETRQWWPVGPDDMAEAPDAAFGDCPGKPTSAEFRGHGMTFDKDTGRLWAINHGGRETVEVIDVTLSGETPTFAWAGCLVAPEGANLNALALTPEGGFATTKFTDTRNAAWVEDLIGVNETGYVYEWHPDTGWSEVEGTGMSGPNGILVSPSGDAYYIAEWAGKKLHRMPRGGSDVEPASVETGILTDNLHWSKDGKVLATGQWVNEIVDYASCMGSPAAQCPVPFKVLEIDPDTMEVTERIAYDGAEFGSGTTGVEIGDEIWVGTTRFDRIGTFPAN